MAEQRLDDADVDPVLEQVGGEAVPLRVRSDPLGDARRQTGLDDEPVQLPRAERLEIVLAGNSQPSGASALLPTDLPPLAQQRLQARREHGVAILPALRRHADAAG
jgi:hypothetical protein